MASTASANGEKGAPLEKRFSRRTWLALARALWAVLSLSGIGISMLGTVRLFYALAQPCTFFPIEGRANCITQRQSLLQLGISPELYAVYITVGVIVEVLPWVIVGVLVFWRKSTEATGLFFSLALILFGTIAVDEPLAAWALSLYPGLQLPVLLTRFFAFSLAVVWYLLPDGRFVPAWTRWLAVGWVTRTFFVLFVWDSPLNPDNWPEPLPLAVVIAFVVSLAFSLIYRYRRGADSSKRQQIKWVVVGAVTYTLVYLVGYFLPFDPSPATQLIRIIHSAFFYIGSSIFAVSIGLAILRYHLWDIDLLLRRTLVYVPLTAILAGILAASTELSTKFFIVLTGGQSDAATIVTTLIVVAAFDPIKTALQSLVDRHFKEAPDSTKRLKAVQSQMRSYLQLADAPEIAQHTLEEAVASFDAAGGAVYVNRKGGAQLVYATENWKGDAMVTVPFAREGALAGRVELGARKDKSDYGETDRAMLQQTVDLMARTLALSERG